MNAANESDSVLEIGLGPSTRGRLVTQYRTCSKCNQKLPLTLEYFRKNQSTNTGGDKYFRPECRECTSRANKRKNEALRLAGKPRRPPLGNPCHICGRKDRKLVFDHDHKTLRHRGWLCDNCNRSLGMLGDTVTHLERAIRYLREGNQHGPALEGGLPG